MGLMVALQMDPVGSVNIEADSTFRIGIEAQARGHSLFFYTPDRLCFREGRVMARGAWIELRRQAGDHVSFGPETEVDLAD
ncbi:MAG TPA: glutathione synthase, partial [Paracoccaceae bacterium]|nr:glutathione synthase [Paracoccaceae bacterium]